MREINLLPPARRRLLRNESLLVSLTGLVKNINAALILISLLGAVMVAIVWLMTFTATLTTQSELSKEVDKFRDLRSQISAQNLMLSYLEDMSRSRVVWSDALEKVFNVAPTGVTFNAARGSAQVLEGEIVVAEITLEGQAPTRRTLGLFEEALNRVEGVVEVESPSTNLLLRDNPTYRFTVRLRSAETTADQGEND